MISFTKLDQNRPNFASIKLDKTGFDWFIVYQIASFVLNLKPNLKISWHCLDKHGLDKHSLENHDLDKHYCYKQALDKHGFYKHGPDKHGHNKHDLDKHGLDKLQIARSLGLTFNLVFLATT